MKKTELKFRPIRLFIAISMILFAAAPARAQHSDATEKAKSGPLYQEILHMDSLLFTAFNTRNLDQLKIFFDAGLELYQDNIGVRNYDQTVAAFGGLFKMDYVLTRQLVPGSLEVYPIKDYGAIETGLHTFSHTENGKFEKATFKFMHVWQKKDGLWKITRLITYDH